MTPHIGIGLMSGTSVDAVDAALVEIDASRPQPVRLLNDVEVPNPFLLQNGFEMSRDQTRARRQLPGYAS